ncbi:MAG: hypothetical protein QOF09_2386 [Alphaproteobacteria bacterium]|nr:hypothetical protein [Alphaproteobacteria bacterium]
MAQNLDTTVGIPALDIFANQNYEQYRQNPRWDSRQYLSLINVPRRWRIASRASPIQRVVEQLIEVRIQLVRVLGSAQVCRNRPPVLRLRRVRRTMFIPLTARHRHYLASLTCSTAAAATKDISGDVAFLPMEIVHFESCSACRYPDAKWQFSRRSITARISNRPFDPTPRSTKCVYLWIAYQPGLDDRFKSGRAA